MDNELDSDERGTDMLNVKLVVVGGAPEGDEFQLELPVVLGRSRDASLPLPHPLVSRKHCELEEQEGCLFVKDLDSTNGTFVGSERVERSPIHHGDLLTIGTLTFRALYMDEPAVAEPGGDVPVPKPQANSIPAEFDTATITRIDTGVVGPGGPKKAARRRHKTQ